MPAQSGTLRLEALVSSIESMVCRMDARKAPQHWLISLAIGSFFLGTSTLLGSAASAQEKDPQEIRILEGWTLSAGPPPRGRSSLPVDPLEHAWIRGELKLPDRSLEESPSAEGIKPWKKATADEQGGFTGRDIMSGWLATYVDVDADGVWLLDAQGHGAVKVNGTPRTGDVYSNGSVELPILLKKGTNHLLFQSGRGRIAAKLKPATKSLFLSTRDTTLPTVLKDEPDVLWGAMLVVNASQSPQWNLAIVTSCNGKDPVETSVPFLAPLSVRKVPFRFDPRNGTPDKPDSDQLNVLVKLVSSGEKEKVIDESTVALQLRNSNQTHRRTFVSEIEGSVQYYGVVPPLVNDTPSVGSTADEKPANGKTATEKPALILSLHGAGVEGAGQAGVYSPKPNTYVITPTNRRSFGFDWEDWGRADALEVLAQAQARFSTDPQRTYLTGHSMGGHGTWHIGTLFPDRFAAIGPSAGWISFSTYAGRGAQQNQDTTSLLLRRPMLVSDTVARVKNLQHQGVYILHGDADDNVPVDQARTMRTELAGFHPDFVYKEQPGAGHWWGNACCDWPPLIEFFKSHRIADAFRVNHLEFATPTPGVSDSCFWARVYQQRRACELSRLDLKLARKPWSISGTTENVELLAINIDAIRDPAEAAPSTLDLDIDGTKVEGISIADVHTLWLHRSSDSWTVAQAPNDANKGPHRNGLLKDAFKNRFVLVYGTQGTEQENDWMLAKARYDAETFWYRGNGSVDLVPDTQWHEVAGQDRNVIVYGNSTVNLAWKELLADSPCLVERGKWQLGKDSPQSESVAVGFIRPRSGSALASVGCIGGTDLAGMMASQRLPIFSSGTAFPDLIIASPEYLKDGVSAIRQLGFFGNDWSVEKGEWLPEKQ